MIYYRGIPIERLVLDATGVFLDEPGCAPPQARTWGLIGIDWAAEERPYLPIHRALSRMLHADERYENRVFMPGGLLAVD